MSHSDSLCTETPQADRVRLGLPVTALIGLALLGVPRIVLHDLGVISEGTLLNAFFVFVPPVVWIVVVLWKRVSTPFFTLVTVGAIRGVCLAPGHQVLWSASFGDSPPPLGGNLTDLAPGIQAVTVRFFASISSLFTGVMVGAVTGLIAWGLSAINTRRNV